MYILDTRKIVLIRTLTPQKHVKKSHIIDGLASNFRFHGFLIFVRTFGNYVPRNIQMRLQNPS